LLQADNDDPEIGEQLTWALPLPAVLDAVRTTQGVSDEVRRKVCEIIEADLSMYVQNGLIQILVVRAYLAILLLGDPERGLLFSDSPREVQDLMDSVLSAWERYYLQ
jgi:hypothetical protein